MTEEVLRDTGTTKLSLTKAPHTSHPPVRGWLLLLCIVLTLLTPLKVLSSHGANGEDVYHPTISLVFDLLLCAWSIYVGVCLWRVRPKAIKKAKVFLWFAVTLNAGIALISWLGPFAKSDEQRSQLFLRALAVVATQLIWLSYLASSKRVQQTFAGEM